MKVCFILPKTYGLFHPEAAVPFGGAEVQFFLLSRALARQPGCEVHFAVGDYGQKGNEVVDGVTLWPSIAPDRSLPKKVASMYKALKRIDAEIYLQMTLTPYSWPMCLWLRARGKKFVFFLAHDRDTDGSILSDLPPALQRAATRVFASADLNIAQNLDQLHALTRRRHRVALLHSSLEGSVISGGTRRYHLWMARAETWKRPELFLQLAAEYPGQSFLMICPRMEHTPEDYYRGLVSRAAGLPNLEFRSEYVPFDGMDDLFARAITFVNTSVQEGFATTFIHAAKCSVPVLSLSVNPDGYLDAHACGFYCEGNWERFKEAFQVLTEEPATHARYAAAAAAYFEREHKLSANAERLLARLKKL